jgi:NAD-dependent deacetylase
MTPERDAIESAAAILGCTRRLVVATGAGMSRESGIPTFRDAPSALWENYDPEDLATPDGFRRNPGLVWRWYAERRRMIARARPHAGHIAVAKLQTMFDSFLLVTQNIDNLHTAAGSIDVVEVHGNIFRYKCFDRGHPVADPGPSVDEPPRCTCGSYVRPDIVWFGELLDAEHIERVYAALDACDTILVVGTSGMVYPAAAFAGVARDAGARVIEVNPERTPLTALADVFVKSGARDALPRIVEAVRAPRRSSTD